MTISRDMLLAVAANATLADTYLEPLKAACAIYGIDTPEREAMFLAQIAHESGGFRFKEEIWGPTAQQRRYDPPSDLAARLGNTRAGDGKKYKGRTFVEITGADNYAKVTARLRSRFDDVPDFVQEPERLADDQWCAIGAADFWDAHGLNRFADAGDFVGCTHVINGGENGLANRQRLWARVKAVQANQPIPPQPRINQETDVGPFALALLPSLLNAAPELIHSFQSKDPSEIAQRNEKAATVAISIAKDALNASNEQEVKEKLDASPEAREIVRQAVKDNWFSIVEAGGGGIAGARDANAKVQGERSFLYNPAVWVSLLLMVLPFMLLVDVFYVHPDSYDGNLRTQIVTAVLAVIMMVGAYWLGTTASSGKKDDTIKSLASQ